MTNRSRSKRSRGFTGFSRFMGFTLIESLMACAVLGIAVAGLVGPFSIAASHQARDRELTTASMLANQLMERVSRMSYQTVLSMEAYVEAGVNMTGLDGQPMNDATLADYIRGVRVDKVLLGLEGQPAGESAVFARVMVWVARRGMPTVTQTKLVADMEGVENGE